MRKDLWNILFAAGAVSLVGCPEAPDDDDATADDDDSVDACPQILSVTPEANETNVFIRTDVRVTFDAPPDGGAIMLMGAADVAGTTETANNGRTLIFSPTADLMANTEYTATVSQACADDASFSFMTGPYGEAVGTEGDLIGNVFNIDLASATFTEPPAVGPLLQGFLTDIYVLFTVLPEPPTDLASDLLHIHGALGVLDGGDIVQDTCNETIPFTLGPDGEAGTGDDTPAGWDNPNLQLGPADLDISVQGVSVTLQDLEITALFHPDLVDFKGGTFAGTIDTRALVGLVDSEDPNAICDLVFKTVGVECEDCGGGEQFCLSVRAEDVSGTSVSTDGLERRGCVDILEDDGCEDNWSDYYIPETTDVDPLLCPDWGAGDDDDSAN